jgi:hypothetical protein
MEEALRFFKMYELWIYLLLGLGGLLYAAKFARAWNELRRSSFGLERESAQARLNRAASVLVLLFIIVITQFTLVTFIVPAVPGANPLLTPTLDLLATPTTTLASDSTPAAQAATPPPAEILQPELLSGCIPGQIELAEPQDGSTVQGIVPIVGTASVPNFGFYKFEMTPANETNWLSIEANNNCSGKWAARQLEHFPAGPRSLPDPPGGDR